MKSINTAVVLTMLLAATASGRSGKNVQPDELLSQVGQERRYRAELRAEANAPGLGRVEQQRIVSALAARQKVEDHQIAEFEKFKMAQQIALAEAQATHIVVNNYPSNTDQRLGDAGSRNARSAKYIKAAFHPQNGGDTARENPLRSREEASASREQPAREKEYPDKFYRMKAIEESVDRLITRIDSISPPPIDDHAMVSGQSPMDRPSDSPYAVPVRSQQGFVTSPYSRYSDPVDVRGYESGTAVQDPATGRMMRVP